MKRMKMEFKKMGWTLMMCTAIAMGSVMTSCSDDNNDGGTTATDPEVTYNGTTAYSTGILFNKGTEIGNGDQNFHFTGNVTLAKGTYLLKGWVYVDAGAKLTIPAGTIIKGDRDTKAALIIERGGYAEIKGTKEAPVIMTSEKEPGQRKPGDWGGLIICGKAPNNEGVEKQIEGGPTAKFGGTDKADNSGIYQYIRVEFAGYPFEKDKEINGVTLGSVGSGTTIDHIQVSYSCDDSFEWFGGTVNCNHLVAYKGWDDEFDTDNGFSGTVQYGLSIRDPRIADTSQSNGFESDNNASGTDSEPFTTATFKNITFIGPKTAKNTDFVNGDSYIKGGGLAPTDHENNPQLGKFQSAMQIRRGSRLNVENSLAVGYPIGLIIDGEKGSTPTYAKEGKFTLKNIIFAGMGVLGSDNNKKYEDELYDKATKTYDATQFSFSHTFFLNEAGTFTTSINNKVMTEAGLSLTDPMSTGQNYCPSTALSDGNGSYIGAFKDASDNWLEGWTNFDPQNTKY